MNYQTPKQIIEELLQQISKNTRPIHQVESTTFSNDVNVTNKCKLMKDCVKDVNIRSSKGKTSKFQSSSKVINDNTMEKSALTTENINIQPNDVRKESRKRFYESKGKKMRKAFPLKK